jgi:hypothetical protein
MTGNQNLEEWHAPEKNNLHCKSDGTDFGTKEVQDVFICLVPSKARICADFDTSFVSEP